MNQPTLWRQDNVPLEKRAVFRWVLLTVPLVVLLVLTVVRIAQDRGSRLYVAIAGGYLIVAAAFAAWQHREAPMVSGRWPGLQFLLLAGFGGTLLAQGFISPANRLSIALPLVGAAMMLGIWRIARAPAGGKASAPKP